jgi:hypothetical protein
MNRKTSNTRDLKLICRIKSLPKKLDLANNPQSKKYQKHRKLTHKKVIKRSLTWYRPEIRYGTHSKSCFQNK